jgi:protein CpxP
MTTVRSLMLAIAVAVAMSLGAVAQTTPTPAPDQNQNPPAQQTPGKHHGRHHHGARGPEQRLNSLDKKVGLTDDQKAKLGPIFQNEAQQAQSIRSDSSLNQDQKKAKMRDLRKSTRSQVSEILTPEQKAKLKSERKEHRHKKQAMGASPEQRLNMLSKRLNLTEDQKAKLAPVFQNAQTQVQSVRQDSSLTPEQKREKIKQIRFDTHKQVASILTPEQQKQLQEGWQHRKESEKAPQS